MTFQYEVTPVDYMRDVNIRIHVVQNYDLVPTSAILEIEADGQLIVRRRELFCDSRAPDAGTKVLLAATRLLKKLKSPPTNVTIVLGNTVLFMLLTGQTYPYTNTLHRNIRAVRKEIGSVTSVKCRLDSQYPLFVEFSAFIQSHYKNRNVVATPIQNGDVFRQMLKQVAESKSRDIP